ncbi:hypothetical protein STEG23_002633, partial [Scotinomys teguina]
RTLTVHLLHERLDSGAHSLEEGLYPLRPTIHITHEPMVLAIQVAFKEQTQYDNVKNVLVRRKTKSERRVEAAVLKCKKGTSLAFAAEEQSHQGRKTAEGLSLTVSLSSPPVAAASMAARLQLEKTKQESFGEFTNRNKIASH